MKKTILIIISILTVLSLAACGGNSTAPASSLTGSATETAGGIDGAANTDNVDAFATATAASQPAIAADAATVTDDNSAKNAKSTANAPTDSKSKILVAYFSATGTTKAIAQSAANAMGADLYEITPAEPYTAADLDYSDKNSRTSKEMDDTNARPAISGSVENMADYDIVFIGYPIWWGETPRIVSTFVEGYDFSGKTVVTFSTSGSSGHNDSSIKPLAEGANWVTGTRFGGGTPQADVAKWIGDLGLDIVVK